MFNQIKKVSAAAALIVALPAIASAQTVAFGNAPVSVTACSINPQIDRLSFVGPIERGSELLRNSNDLTLNYVNTGNVAATSITFAVNDGKRTQDYVANGTYAPGVNIAQTFTASTDPQPGNAASCTVAQVRFADGHVWQAVPSVVSRR